MFKKVISMLLVCVMMMSISCIGASAKEVYEMADGVKLILSDTSENTSKSDLLRYVDTTFSVTAPVYPSSTLLLSGNLTLDSAESKLEIEFDSTSGSDIYISLYDLTSGRYITSGTDGLYGPFATQKKLTFTGLTGGHSFRIRVSAANNARYLSGTITSY